MLEKRLWDAADQLRRAFTPEIYQTKCTVLFEHVFETFGDATIPSLTPAG